MILEKHFKCPTVPFGTLFNKPEKKNTLIFNSKEKNLKAKRFSTQE